MTEIKSNKWKKLDLLRDILCVLIGLMIIIVYIMVPFLNHAEKLARPDGASELKYGNTAQKRANFCRDSIYSDLCTLGTVYLSNCSDGIYDGTGMLYEQMLASLSWFMENNDKDNIFGIDTDIGTRGLTIEQTNYNITNIDSAYYYFFVSYGDEYLTNIPEYKNITKSKVPYACKRLSEENNNYYLRTNNTISSDINDNKPDNSKTEVYYSITDGSGKIISTSEYIRSDKLVLGSVIHDNIGNYIYCFNKNGDVYISSYPKETDDIYPECYLNENGSITVYTYDEANAVDREEVFTYGSDGYKSTLNLTNGAFMKNSWIDLNDIPGYAFATVDTSELNVFMMPKTDILKYSEELINNYERVYNSLDLWITVIISSTFVFLAVILLLSVIRPVPAYISDKKTLKGKVFRLDSSLLVIILNLAASKRIVQNVIYSEAETEIKRNIPLYLVVFVSVMLLFLSFDGIVRVIKLKIVKEKYPLLIKEIWDHTEKLRSVYRDLAFVKWHRSLSLKTRYAIMHTELIIVGAIYAVIQLITYMNTGGFRFIGYWSFDIFDLVLGLFVLLAFRYLFFTISVINNISRAEDQIDRILGLNDDPKECRPVSANSPVASMSKKLQQISDATQQAVEQQVKSEKMKVELVTNVSHDLKTPLTSIIGYIDLLQKTDLSDEARDYVNILGRKSEKLRDIVQDVFSLAKAVSGIEVDIVKLDFAMLIRQVLADNEDKINDSDRDVRQTIDISSAMINADGVKMYRVIQNLIDNALKYSMPNTRVYIVMSETDSEYRLSVKNVSAEEMDFTAEEITERFARGDKSRTDGGSGLGLSIAKSFTEACGGRFEIEIDGDVFNAVVSFDKIVDDISEGTAEPSS